MKFALFLFVIFLPLGLWAQGGEVIVIRNSDPASKSPQPRTPDPTANYQETEITDYEMSPDQVDETFVDSAADIREERAREVGKISEVAPTEVFDPVAELKALGHDNITSSTMLDERAVPIFVKMLKQSNLRSQTPEALKELIFKQFQNQPLGVLFKKCDTCLNVFVDVLRDEKALPGLLQIMTMKGHLKKYFYVWLALFLFFFWLRPKLISRHAPFFTKLFRSVSLSLLFSFLSLYVFYKMFYKQTSPTVTIIERYL